MTSTFYLGQIEDHRILVIPSQSLKFFIKNIKITYPTYQIPLGIQTLIFNDYTEHYKVDIFPTNYLISEGDRKFMKSFICLFKTKAPRKFHFNSTNQEPHFTNQKNGLYIEDLHWLYQYIQRNNKAHETKIYLHELMEGSEIVLPKNKLIARNNELDKKIQNIKASNKYVGFKNGKKEDTISFQIKMMNRHIIAIFQYILSIITGFVFGFYGIEMLTTPLDLGFRLLLGVICSLTIALAELYFLATALNMDLQDSYPTSRHKTIKIS